VPNPAPIIGLFSSLPSSNQTSHLRGVQQKPSNGKRNKTFSLKNEISFSPDETTFFFPTGKGTIYDPICVAFIDIENSKIDYLRFVMCPLLAPVFQGFFFFFLQWPLTVLIKQTRQAVRAFKQLILLRCLWLHCPRWPREILIMAQNRRRF
jgi:hypothetical protein